MNDPASIRRNRVGAAARYAASAALLGVMASFVDWGRFRGIGGIAPGPAAAAVLAAGITYPLQAVRWWMLLRAQGCAAGLGWVHTITWVSTFTNCFLPGGIGGDAARVYYVIRDEPDRRARAAVTVALDRLLGLLPLAGLAALALVIAPAPAPGALLDAAGWLVLAGVAALGILLFVPARLWLPRLPRIPEAWRGEAIGVADAVRRSPGVHVAALGLSTVVWLLDIAAFWLLARAVGLDLPPVETGLAVSVAYLASVLPISIGGHGVREGALLGVLGAYGLLPGDTGAGAALGVLAWALVAGWGAFGGLFLFAVRRSRVGTAA